MDTIIIVLAIWGALLSTFLAILKILDFRRERPNVRVVFMLELQKRNDRVLEPYFVLKAFNKGRRIINLEEAGLWSSVKTGIMTKQGWSAQLGEQGSVTVRFGPDDLKDVMSAPGVFVKSGWFKDVTGKFYHVEIPQELAQDLLGKYWGKAV